MESYLKKYYQESIVPKLKETRGYKNIHEVPFIEKVVINSGFSSSLDKGQIEEITKEITNIAGQRAVVTKARKSISNFKLREGMPIGVKVTLRGNQMYDFLYKLLMVALPGIRDFRGVRDKLDGTGNYTLGISDHTIFPEAHHEGSKQLIGMDVCITTSAQSDDEARELLSLMGMPFRKRASSAQTETATA